MTTQHRVELFLKRLIYAFLRILFRTEHPALPLEEGRLKRVLVFRYDRLGDMVVSQPALRFLASKGVAIDVLATKRNVSFLDDCDYVQNTFLFESQWGSLFRLIRRLRKERYDAVLCMVFFRSTNAGILAHMVAPGALVVGRYFEGRADLYSTLFSVSVKMNTPQSTMVEHLVQLCSALYYNDFRNDDVDYRLSIRAERFDRARELLQSLITKPFVILNISAGMEARNIDEDYGGRIIGAVAEVLPTYGIAIMHMPEHRQRAERLVASDAQRCVLLASIPHILDVAALMSYADAIITPDTSLAHIADALSIPMLSFHVGQNYDWVPTKTVNEVLRCRVGQESVRSIRIEDVQSALLKLKTRAKL